MTQNLKAMHYRIVLTAKYVQHKLRYFTPMFLLVKISKLWNSRHCRGTYPSGG